MIFQERAREWLNKMGLSTSVQSMFRVHSLEALLQSVADETWEEAADIAVALDLHMSVKEAQKTIAAALRAKKSKP